MKIPFDIKYRPQIESGEYKVETRDGRSVHILSYDVPGKYCIVGVMTPNDGSNVHYPVGYTVKGTECSYPNSRDLFIITPDPELTELEKAVKDLCWKIGMGEVVYKDDIIKKIAAELLELARKELIEEQLTPDPKLTEFELRELRQELAKERGKDLPRWVKVNEGDLLDKYSRYLLCSNEGYYFCWGTNITRDGYMLLMDDLEKLPKEEQE